MNDSIVSALHRLYSTQIHTNGITQNKDKSTTDFTDVPIKAVNVSGKVETLDLIFRSSPAETSATRRKWTLLRTWAQWRSSSMNVTQRYVYSPISISNFPSMVLTAQLSRRHQKLPFPRLQTTPLELGSELDGERRAESDARTS